MRRRWDAQWLRWGAKLLLPVLAVFYLCYHAVSGERGIYAWFSADRELKALQTQLADVQAQRGSYENKIKGMRPQSLDLDLLDEQARTTLGYVRHDEIILPEESVKKQ